MLLTKPVEKYCIGVSDVKANHGGIKGESVEDSETTLADAELSVTPSRQRRPLRLAADTDDRPVDSEDQLIQDDDGADLTQQHDVTVSFSCSIVFCFVFIWY